MTRTIALTRSVRLRCPWRILAGLDKTTLCQFRFFVISAPLNNPTISSGRHQEKNGYCLICLSQPCWGRFAESRTNVWATSSTAFTASVISKFLNFSDRFLLLSSTFICTVCWFKILQSSAEIISQSFFSICARITCSFDDATFALAASNVLSDFVSFAASSSDAVIELFNFTGFSATPSQAASSSLTVFSNASLLPLTTCSFWWPPSQTLRAASYQ